MRIALALTLMILLSWTQGSEGRGNSSPLHNELEEDTPEESLEQLERRLRKLVSAGFKLALPYLVTGATEVRIHTRCMQGLLLTLRGLIDLKDWAIRMVDAMGKPPSGVLSGAATWPGDLDECVAVEAPRRMRPVPVPPYRPHQVAFVGQHCTIRLALPPGVKRAAMDYQRGNRETLDNSTTFLRNVAKFAPRADVAEFRLGLCVPSVCDREDLQAILDQVAGLVKIEATALRCVVKQEGIKIRIEQVLILCVAGLLLALVCAGTAMDVVIRFRSGEMIDGEELEKKSVRLRSLLAFSMPRNAARLLSLEGCGDAKLASLRGIKFFSVCLFMLVRTYASPDDFHFMKFRGAFSFLDFLEQWWFAAFANASAGVDTLFLVAGLQASFGVWSRSGGGAVKVSVRRFALQWWARFALAQMLVIALVLLLPLLATGPLWGDIVDPAVQNCRERWWLNLLAINNFWPAEQVCLPHAWLLCSLLHLMFLAAIVLYIMSKSRTVGVMVNVAIMVGSGVAIAIVTLMNRLPPAPAFYFLSFLNVKTIWEKLFIQAYDHVGPFCLGLLLGVFLARRDKLTIGRTVVAVGWLLALSGCLSVLCGLYSWRAGGGMPASLSALYAAAHRTVWAAGIAWIVAACAYGYGGFVDSILSWPGLAILDRLTSLTFLLHPVVFLLHEGQLRQKMYMGHLDQAMYATAYIVFSVALAAAVYVTCAAPFRFFERLVFGDGERLTADTSVTVPTGLGRRKTHFMRRYVHNGTVA